MTGAAGAGGVGGEGGQREAQSTQKGGGLRDDRGEAAWCDGEGPFAGTGPRTLGQARVSSVPGRPSFPQVQRAERGGKGVAGASAVLLTDGSLHGDLREGPVIYKGDGDKEDAPMQ